MNRSQARIVWAAAIGLCHIASAPAAAAAGATGAAPVKTSATAPAAGGAGGAGGAAGAMIRTWIERTEAETAVAGRGGGGPNSNQLVRLWARAGDDGAARRIIAQYKTRDIELFATLAGEQARRGDVDAALQTAGAIPEADKIDRVLWPIAQRRAAAGDFAAAKAIADRFTTAGSRESCYEDIFTAGTKTRGMATAQATAQGIPDVLCRRAAYQGIARAQALAGDDAGALRTINLLDGGRQDISQRLVRGWKAAGPFMALAGTPGGELFTSDQNCAATDDMRHIPGLMELLGPALTNRGNRAAGDRAIAAAMKQAAGVKDYAALAYTYIALTQAETGDKTGAKATAAKAMALIGNDSDNAHCAPRLAGLVTRLEGVAAAADLAKALSPRQNRYVYPAIGYSAVQQGKAAELAAFVGRQPNAGARALLLCGGAWAALERSKIEVPAPLVAE